LLIHGASRPRTARSTRECPRIHRGLTKPTRHYVAWKYGPIGGPRGARKALAPLKCSAIAELVSAANGLYCREPRASLLLIGGRLTPTRDSAATFSSRPHALWGQARMRFRHSCRNTYLLPQEPRATVRRNERGASCLRAPHQTGTSTRISVPGQAGRADRVMADRSRLPQTRSTLSRAPDARAPQARRTSSATSARCSSP
jgi:hypothetical protein